ncbi:protein PTST homolog 3, chloroplastic isoform X2 [Magnolia sinica]|uniref:protein PTST homolog 3, chloroplastic isoform X2 n=1 Tax=Magnolia sinica TaxID=86752 RepID=UPI0026591BC0|nr:protein PTST homolog 3, chloroplastic isoform X2 [Magnolia sinica]
MVMMATLYRFPSNCLTSRNELSSSSFVAVTVPLVKMEEHLHLPVPSFSCPRTIMASSGKKSRASKKSKVTRSTKSNADLCNDLREFISVAGLPETSVPSMKVLSEYGRKDLANIVRRRGYKVIAELLMNTTKVDANIERNFSENHDAGNANGSNSIDGQEKRMDELHVDVSLPSKASIVEDHLSSTNGVAPMIFGTQMCESIGYSVKSSLHEKASKFIQSGELETIEGMLSTEDMQMLNDSDVSYGSSNTSGTDSGMGSAESENDIGVEPTAYGQETSISESTGGNDVPISSAGALASKQVALLAKEHKPHRDDNLHSEDLNFLDFDEDLSVQARKRDNETEIDRLKVMLQQKELELSQLKQQIEKEKLALSILQSKANTELGDAQKLISAKDVELHAAEESLFGLKEVEIEYWGNGETVEVAGSFNGWHHPIRMDHHSSSKTINPTGLRS